MGDLKDYMHSMVINPVDGKPMPNLNLVYLKQYKENSAFLDLYWFNGINALNDTTRAYYVNHLRMFNIKNQYMDLGKMKDDGTFKRDYGIGSEDLNAYTPAALQAWIAKSRATDPNQKLIGVINYGLWRLANRPGGFNITTFKNNVNTEINTLFSYGIDGIHFDLEGYNANDNDLITLLTHLRANSLQGNKNVSISSTHESLLWNKAYITSLTPYINEFNPMIYDLWFDPVQTVQAYVDRVRAVLMRYSDAISGTDCKLAPFLPAYSASSDHHTDIESVTNCLEGARIAISQGANVTGMSFFFWPQFAGYASESNYPKAIWNADQVAYYSNWVEKYNA